MQRPDVRREAGTTRRWQVPSLPLGALRGPVVAPWQWPALVEDSALAVTLGAVDLLVLLSGMAGMPVWDFAYLAVGFVPLLWRRRHSLLVFGLVWLHVLGAAFLTFPRIPTLNLLAAVYAVAAVESLRRSVAVLVLAYLVHGPVSTAADFSTEEIANPAGAAVALLVLYAVVFAVGWVLGRWVQFSRRRLDNVEERRQRAAAEAVAAERRRMARELHDVVSHSVSVMVLQAAGARRVLAADPERAQQALSQIEGLGKQSMTELRRLLGVLRDGAFVENDAADELGARPGLAGLADLLEGFRTGGLTVTSQVVGRPVDLDGSVDLSAYRIVQEALTNAGKHGGPGTAAAVRQVWADDVLVLEVTDDGRGVPSDEGLSTGSGLAGLRERARAVGGHLEATAVPGGGFRVSATLPVRQPAAGDPAPQPGARAS
jgi:signal transduction histidine kinase